MGASAAMLLVIAMRRHGVHLPVHHPLHAERRASQRQRDQDRKQTDKADHAADGMPARMRRQAAHANVMARASLAPFGRIR